MKLDESPKMTKEKEGELAQEKLENLAFAKKMKEMNPSLVKTLPKKNERRMAHSMISMFEYENQSNMS